MRHLRQAWAAIGVPQGGERFTHFWLPEDPDEAHLALVHLVQGRTAVRRTAADEPTEYDHGRLADLVAEGGFSHHPQHGKAPSSGYMASYHAPEGSGTAVVHPMSQISHHPEHIAEHRHNIAEHLTKPDSYQGGWHDKAEDEVYLDASRHFDSEKDVRDFSLKEKQKAYFNLGTFEEHFLHPKLDPDAMKDDQGPWRAKYAHLPEHERENPPAGYEDFAHLYPATDKQKEFWAGKGEHLANKMAGRPVGPWRNQEWINDRLRERHGL